MRKNGRVWFGLLVMLPGLSLVPAANHYVRQGASGSGTDWANARGSLPSALVRGDTYYVGDGSYGPYAAGASTGTGTITIKKAIASDHGTDTGWDNAYGDGQATFSGISINTSNLVLDGQTGGGPGQWNTGFGFEITRTTSTCGDNGALLSLAAGVNTVTVRHVHMYSGSKNYPLAGIKGTSGVTGLTFAYNSVHTIFGVHFHMGTWRDCVIEYSYLADNRSTGAGDPYCSDWHAEGISSIGLNQNITIRYCLWDRVTGTAVIAGINNGTAEAWKIYGNIFSRSVTTIYSYYAGTNMYTMNNLEFYNNDVIGIPGVSQGGIVINRGTGNRVTNNIWYNNIANAFGFDATHSYNYFAENRRVEGCSPNPCDKDAEAAAGDAGAQLGSAASPFVSGSGTTDPLAGDFRLKAATNAGTVLAAEFKYDMFGNERGADGVWDRGAVEYSTTNIEYRILNGEFRMPRHPTLINTPRLLRAGTSLLATINDGRIYNLKGERVLPAKQNQTGIFLVTDGKGTTAKKVMVIK